jgi:hypothetical protein
VLPSVRAENSEVGTTATVTLDIDDPQCRVVEVRFRHRVQPSAWSAYTVDTTVPYSYSETIPTTGFLEIEWEVRGYDSTGTLITLATAIEYFDADDAPDITNIAGSFTEVGGFVLAIAADTDAQSLKFATSQSGYPTATTVRAAAANNARNVETTLTGPVAINGAVYVSAFAYSEVNGGGLESGIAQAVFVRDGVDIRVEEEVSETATQGQLVLRIADPNARISSVQARTKAGHAAFSSYATISNTGTSTARVHTVTVALVEKVPSVIEYRIIGTTPTGTTAQTLSSNTVTFAMGTKPFIPDLFVTVREDGTVDALVQGDSDTASIRIGYSTASQATADTNAASATAVNGRTRTALNIGSLTLGQKAFVSALAYSGTGGTGEVSEVAQAEIVRANVSSTRTVRWNTAGAFQPQFPSTTSVARDLFGYIPMINLSGVAFHFATLPVPVGATLQAVTVRVDLLLAFAGTGSVTMRLYRLENDGIFTQLGTDQVISANGTQTLTVGSLSESVTATRSYVVELEADSSDTSNLATAFYADITYLSPNLTVNL